MIPQNTELESKFNYVQYKLIPKIPVLEIVTERSSIMHRLSRWKEWINCNPFTIFYLLYFEPKSKNQSLCNFWLYIVTIIRLNVITQHNFKYLKIFEKNSYTSTLSRLFSWL
jgi:hypothetical protein